MNSDKTIFAQVMDFLPMNDFRKCVKRYQGNYKTQKFSCLDQFLCIEFAQLTNRESLRDIEICPRSVHGKFHHMGFPRFHSTKYFSWRKRKSSLAHLCLSLFPWARFRKRKGAVKTHTVRPAWS
jgi:hypothetical protein